MYNELLFVGNNDFVRVFLISFKDNYGPKFVLSWGRQKSSI